MTTRLKGASREGSSRKAILLAFLLYFAVAVALQWVGGAYGSEFGEHADEPAHYITGLMVRDYIGSLASLDFTSPIEYAKRYYEHYPKVGLGHWPPGFYVVQAAWTLVFSPHRASLMLLLAAMAALLATLTFTVARREFPAPIAVTAGLMVAAHPLVQAFTREMMAELMTATTVFLAVVCYAWYLDSEKGRYSMAFGFFAALAALTKGTGFMLAGIPPLCVLLTRRFRFLLKPSYWAAALVVLALAGPWYYLAPGATHESAVPTSGMVRSPQNLGSSWYDAFIVFAGVGLVPFIGIGLADRVLVPMVRRRSVGGIWAASAAAIVCMVMMRALVTPARPPRHLLNMLPPVFLFAIAGLVCVFSLKPLRRLAPKLAVAAIVLILAVLFFVDYRHLRPKEYVGFEPVALEILKDPRLSQSVALVSSDPSGEGMFISEMAMNEPRRPGHIVLRGSKILSSATWFGWNARLLFNTPEELNQFLADVPVGLVVFDTDPPRPPLHHILLEQVLKGNPQQWQLAGRFPQRRGSGDRRGGIELYRLVDHEGKPARNVPSQLRKDFTGD
ncbi:MAG: glycosyltransferase family 39 protein [Bryobacteraceae bacterium]|nr:glycosyltransferase family 39 protein [Bryobacteraceae bacterium]